MDYKSLENKWESIVYTWTSVYEFVRIDSICIPELFIGLNSSLNRCLILELPENNKVDFQSTVKQNLTIEFYRDTNYIVIQLTGNDFKDLFNDLIISLYHRIKSISNVDIYSRELIQTFYKWSEFFEDRVTDRLSDNQIKGLLGELLILRMLVSNTESGKIDYVLSSWKGPYDLGHDFVFDEKDIEVKTKDFSKSEIHISSEYQLESELDKPLELTVVSVEANFEEGLSIKDLVLSVKDLIMEKLGDSSILLKAISQKGLSMKNLSLYDNYKFKPINQVVYKCTDTFPKLVRSNIPIEVGALKYNLRTSLLTQFIVDQKDF